MLSTRLSTSRSTVVSWGWIQISIAGICVVISTSLALSQESGKGSGASGKQESSGQSKEQEKSPEVEESIEASVTKVIDGDSVKVKSAEGKEYEVQIEGTDAPELKQAYGKESTAALKKLLGDSKLRVTWLKKDNFERPLAQIYVGDMHVNAEMIRTGNAWHFKRYNQSKELADLEIEAKKEKRGLWGTDNPQAPWDYRKENRTPDKPDRSSNTQPPANDK